MDFNMNGFGFQMTINDHEFIVKSSFIRQYSKLIDRMLEYDQDNGEARTLDLTDITDTTTLQKVIKWMQTGDIGLREEHWQLKNVIATSSAPRYSDMLLNAVKIYTLADHLQVKQLKDLVFAWCQTFLQQAGKISQIIWPALSYTITHTSHTDTDLRLCMIKTCIFDASMQELQQNEPDNKIFVFVRRQEPVLIKTIEYMAHYATNMAATRASPHSMPQTSSSLHHTENQGLPFIASESSLFNESDSESESESEW